MIDVTTEYDEDHRIIDRFGTCECGKHIDLMDGMTNECDHCHRLYNGSGQALNPPHMWEEPWDEE